MALPSRSIGLFLCLAIVAPAAARADEAMPTPNFQTVMRKALDNFKAQRQDRNRKTIAGLVEQVEGDFEPELRLQAAVLLAAHYWDSNYRMSRYYLGIAESLRAPTTPELRRYDTDIGHLKIRFRQAALADGDTKLEIENQLKLNPSEPIRLSLIEMLMETNRALGRDNEFLNVYHKLYGIYPRAVRKDHFARTAAEIYRSRNEFSNYFAQLEVLLDQYPMTEESDWALDKLLYHSEGRDHAIPRYYFTYAIFKKIYRNSSHDTQKQARISSLINAPLRKMKDTPATIPDSFERIKLFCYLQKYAEALDYIQTLLARGSISGKDTDTLYNWRAFILAERGDHLTALQQYRNNNVDLLFQESEAKSLMSAKKFKEAAIGYRSLIKRNDQPRYRWYYFWNLLAAGNIDNAENFVAHPTKPLFAEAEYRIFGERYWHAKALIISGKLAKAQTLLESILDQSKVNYYKLLARKTLPELKAKQAQLEKTEKDDIRLASLDSNPPQIIPASYPSPDIEGEISNRSPIVRRDLESFQFDSLLTDLARQIEIDPYLVKSIVRAESAFNPRAISSAGAQGLMQIMPYTALRLANMLGDKDFKLEQLQTTDMNLLYGTLYLSFLLNFYQGNPVPAIAAYNAGPRMVNKWLQECRNCPTDAFVEFIPYAETRNYVKKVLTAYSEYRIQELHSEPEFLETDLPRDLPQTLIF